MKHWQDTRGQTVFPEKGQAIGRKVFIFDPNAGAWAAYSPEGDRIMTGSASGGKDYCDDTKQSCRTVSGTFYVYNKRGEDCKSGEYPIDTNGGAKMPYCMHFFRGYTIHAAYEVPKYNSSHGCIRILPGAARWLNENFMEIGTKVIVLPYKKALEAA